MAKTAKTAKTNGPKSTAPEVGNPTKFVVTGQPVKTAEAKKRDANKGKEPWRHKMTTGKAHPDNKPPLSIVAEPSEENKKKYEDAINAEREKSQPTVDWRDLEGGVPADESKAPEAKHPAGPASPHPTVESKSDKKK